jgi:mannosyltransferase OCH1-like enzyme
MIRYFILYDFGGIYADLDMFPQKRIDDYLTLNSDYFVYSSNGDVITNSLMISRKGSSIMKKMQENLKKELPWFAIGKHLNVLFSTGPRLLDSTLLNDIKEPFAVLPRKLFNPYSIVMDEYITDNIKESYMNTVDGTSTWNGYDTLLYNFVTKYRTFFITFGVIFFILIIFFLIYYISKYRKCKESKKCVA